MNGLERGLAAVARAAGWEWCDEHRRPRYDGAEPCDRLHNDLPRGSFICADHGRVHTADEQAVYCEPLLSGGGESRG